MTRTPAVTFDLAFVERIAKERAGMAKEPVVHRPFVPPVIIYASDALEVEDPPEVIETAFYPPKLPDEPEAPAKPKRGRKSSAA